MLTNFIYFVLFLCVVLVGVDEIFGLGWLSSLVHRVVIIVVFFLLFAEKLLIILSQHRSSVHDICIEELGVKRSRDLMGRTQSI